MADPSVGDSVQAARFATNPNPAACGQNILFNSTGSVEPIGHNIVSYIWDFGDGTTGVHAFAQFGRYTANLTITNDSVPMLTDSQTHSVIVNLGNHASIGAAGLT